MVCYALLAMNNRDIAKLLQNVAAAYIIKDQQKFRFQIIAYQKAAEAIEASPTEVKDLIKEGKIEQIPGVGPSIRGHLEELIKSGQVKHFDSVLKGIPKAMFPLLDIPTFGPKKAYKLVTEFKLVNEKTVIEDVQKIAQEGKIRHLDSFGEKSEQDIIRAIDEFKKGKGKTRRMVLPFASELADELLAYLSKSKAVTKAVPLGSLRRMVSTIGDIDFAISTQKPQEAIDYFVKYPRLERIIEKGPTSASLLASGGKQVDLIALPQESFGSLLQHFTGSKNHNVRLREYALSKGMSLSERGIKKKVKGKEVLEHFDSEEKFYNALGMDWIPPEIREDTGEIEKAIAHDLPKLIELSDIKGDMHIHSNYPIEPSHDLGQNTMEEMLAYAQEKKYEYLGFSEHNPSVSKHTKEDIYEIMSKRKDKIEQLKKSNKSIRILNMLELDILVDGSLAIDNKSLELVDAVLVSIHSSFGMSRDEMTKRVLKGLSNPKAKILSHPTGRLLNERPGYELDFHTIFEFCKKNNKALEINSSPARLDLPDSLVREATKFGVKMIINTDSHATEHMNMMKYGVSVARRGWSQKRDILNTLPYNEFEAFLKNQ